MFRRRFSMVLVLAACGGGGEAARVMLPVKAGGAGIDPITTDLGYEVTLTTYRAAFKDLQFTVEGEAHAGLLRRVADWIVPPAYAHPGHLAGGDVTGELTGAFVVDFTVETDLGMGTLLEGDYNGANFGFRRAAADDGLPAGDPLLGHSVELAGTATKDARTITFHGVIDIDDGTEIVGLPLELVVDANTTSTLVVEALTQDPFEPDTMLDGVDFATFAGKSDALEIAPGSDVHNIIRRAVQVHDFYEVFPR